MIFSALLSFLGGSAFRMIWGEVANWLNRKLDHEHEIARMTLQKELDLAAHERTMAALRLQNELGLRMVEAEMQAGVNIEEARSFSIAQANAFKPTGIDWVDAWNGVIRPAAATIVLVLWLGKVMKAQGVMDAFDMELMSAILGFFFADRSLGKRGK